MPLEPNLYIMSVKAGEMLQSPKRTVFFVVEKQKRNIKIVADRKNNAKFICNGEEYIVIDGDLKVKVNTDVDISKYGIRYETTNFRLKDFTCIEDEGCKTFLISELLNICELQKINIFTYGDNKIEASYNVVKFNGISITYDKKLYFDENNLGTVRFLTEKYDKSVTFDINQGDIIIPFDDGDVVLSPPVLKWKIGNGEFSAQYGGDLWYNNYSNADELIIDIPMIGYQVFLSNNRSLTESAKLHSFKFGETIYSMLNEEKDLSVFIKTENMEIISIFTICFKEKFKSPPFVINGKNLIWNSSKAFVGNNTAKFRISFYENNTVIYSFEIDEQITESYQSRSFSLSNIEMGFYNITIDLIKQIGFTKKAIHLFEQKIVYGDINKIRFKGKCLYFNKVMLTESSDYEEIRPFYVDHLWYIGEYEDCRYYTGSVYVTTRNGRKNYLNTMPNSEGTYDKINPIRLELKSERSCFIVAGVNSNDMYDFLGEFTLDTLNRRISNFNKNAKGIDYFIFNTEECR